MAISRAFLLLLYFVTLSIAVIDVPITVKDTSGHGSPFGFPTSVVIPLPYGEFQTTTSFRMTDSAGSSVPSQFNIQTRWADKDNSIREVVVHFSPSVDSYTGPGTGVSVYHFRTDGSGDLAPSTNAITVTESTDLWTVSNSLISIEVAKKNFTTLSNLKLNGQDLLTSSGGVLMDRLGNVQSDAQLPIYSAEIEENGPMRVVLKVTALTVLPQCQQFKSDSCDGFTKLHCEDGEVPQVQHGFAVRIYAYANQSFVKIDYQLQNSQYSDMIYGYPLYFDELRLDFSVKLNSGASTVTIGKGDGTTWTNSLTSNGWQLYQDVPTKNGNVFRIRDAKSKSPSFSGAESDGFVDISDTTGGVLAFIRNFWQNWPNAIKTSIQDQSNVNLSVELFPSDGTMLGYYGNVSNTGIYWLDDMQHVYKEVYLYAHDSQVSTEEKIAMATRFQWFPVAVVPANWYRDTSVTLDMGGYIPSQEDPIDYDDQRNLVTEQANDVTGEYSNFETYLYPFHWRHFGATDSGYRDSSCTTGGTPYSVGRYVVTGSPVDYFRALDRGVGELNTRPQWMSPNYRFNESGAFNSPGAYCGNSWRYFCNSDQNVAPRLPDTNGIINPRDDQHGWFHYVLESYSITGNLWIKDWYKFIGEFRKSRLYEGAVPFPDLSSRGTGHAFAHAVQAFRATGDKSIAEGLKYNIRAYRRPYIDPRWGTNLYSIESNGGGYQTGYYCRAIINWLEETSDPQAWAEGFQLVAALVNYNQKLSHFAYYWQPDDNPADSYSASASGSETNADPVAWYYYHTGIEEYRKIVVQFQETGVPGFDGANEVPGGLPYEDLRSTWTGSFIGRLTKDLFNETFMSHDTRPNKIEDLGAWVDGSVKLAWTTPSNAVKFHFVWSTQRISEEHTLDPNITNWWAANVVGTSLVAVPGSRQTISFDGLTGVSDYYVAMFTWDSIGNMSPMSNVAVSVNGPFPGVTGGPSTTAGSSATGPNGDNGNDADVSIGDVCQVSVVMVILSCLVNLVFY